eukprot:snap_masked-scaffold_12-processed-gene-6.7-mRNA-1 protein AED:1.00 eAED:1.00 QI:0/-1/0/0/-1/1/1/0/80
METYVEARTLQTYVTSKDTDSYDFDDGFEPLTPPAVFKEKPRSIVQETIAELDIFSKEMDKIEWVFSHQPFETPKNRYLD